MFFEYTEQDLLNVNIEDEFKKLINWEVWDKCVKDFLSNIKVNPVQIDTLCDYIRMLLPSTIEVEIERTFYGCILGVGGERIYVIITPDDITVKSFEQLPRSSFMFDILKYTGKYAHDGEYDWEYQFELPEVLKDEHRDSV